MPTCAACWTRDDDAASAAVRPARESLADADADGGVADPGGGRGADGPESRAADSRSGDRGARPDDDAAAEDGCRTGVVRISSDTYVRGLTTRIDTCLTLCHRRGERHVDAPGASGHGPDHASARAAGGAASGGGRRHAV